MTKKVAINGFGRIGRLVFRALLDDPDYDIVLINDLASPESLAYLLSYDSIHGRLERQVQAAEGYLVVGNNKNQDFRRERSGKYFL